MYTLLTKDKFNKLIVGMKARNDKPFIIMIEESCYKKGDIIGVPLLYDLKVIKVYKYNWYRKLLEFFGFKFHNKNCLKVKNIY